MLRGAGQQESNRITQRQKRRAQSREKAVVWGRTGSKKQQKERGTGQAQWDRQSELSAWEIEQE